MDPETGDHDSDLQSQIALNLKILGDSCECNNFEVWKFSFKLELCIDLLKVSSNFKNW